MAGSPAGDPVVAAGGGPLNRFATLSSDGEKFVAEMRETWLEC